MKNNLFTYATSELSQDAFICWLMSYAIKDSRPDKALRNCAVAFIKEFIPELSDVNNADIFVTDIYRQHKEKGRQHEEKDHQRGKIDVLLTINDKYWVIIEDKTFTSDHGNQLKRYKDILIKDGVEEKAIYCVYYKT